MAERGLGRLDEALADLREAWSMAEVAGEKSPASLFLSNIAETEFVMGRRTEGLKDARTSLAMARELGTRPEIAHHATVVGMLLLHADALDEAEPVLREAVASVESMRLDTTGGEITSQSFLHRHAQLYDSLVELLEKRGRRQEAFEVAERAKARVLVDVLRAGAPASRER
jgi:hypothetical protein